MNRANVGPSIPLSDQISIVANRRNRFISCGSLAVVFIYLWSSQAARSGVCVDESGHIPAGVYHLQTGQMDAYRVNPPLPRMVAAIPLLFCPPEIQWKSYDSPYVRSEYRFASAFVAQEHGLLRTQLLLCRTMMLLFFALGLWSIAHWANQMHGSSSAGLAACLWTLHPDVITHSAVAASDLPAASTGLFCGYRFWCWLRSNDRPYPWGVAASVALAIACKFTWLILLPTLPMVVLARDTCLRLPSPWKHATRLILSFSLTLFLINAISGFDGTGTRLGDFPFISARLAGMEVSFRETGNRFVEGPFASLPIPLPEQMLLGLDYLQWEFEQGMPCYLNGAWKDRGWWHFYLFAMALKMPLGYWLMIFLGLVATIADTIRGHGIKLVRWLPFTLALVFLAVVSSQTGFTHHVRYVLPVYGFLFLQASGLMVSFGNRRGTAIAVVCLSGVVISQMSQPGLSHTFFNGAVGANDGWKHLGFSNIDWGQSTFRMLDWVEQHPEKRPLTVLFANPLLSPGESFESHPGVATSVRWRETLDPPRKFPGQGWYLMSTAQLISPENVFFRSQEIVSRPYPDVLLFHVEPHRVSQYR